MQRVADDLVADGQARYEQNPDHQRSHFLEITSVGRATLASISRTAQAANSAFLAGIAEDDLERTRHVLATVIRRLDTSHRDNR